MAAPGSPFEFAFTVFTPTYNRAHTLAGVYRSLAAQTFRDFEWVIVDDGSRDNTAEMVRGWIPQSDFPIRYFSQPNSGKHVAFNRGVREARGELFLSFDSDDTCVPVALERFWYHWSTIEQSERAKFSTVGALCMTPAGAVIGSPYPADVYDAHSFVEQCRLRAAERWGVNRTDILREFPYEEIPGEKFIPEGCVWNRLSARYSTRYINEKLRIYEAGSDSLSTDTVALRARNPKGATVYYAELSEYPVSLHERIKSLINCGRFALHGRESVGKTMQRFRRYISKLLYLAILPVAFFVYQRDLSHLR